MGKLCLNQRRIKACINCKKTYVDKTRTNNSGHCSKKCISLYARYRGFNSHRKSKGMKTVTQKEFLRQHYEWKLIWAIPKNIREVMLELEKKPIFRRGTKRDIKNDVVRKQFKLDRNRMVSFLLYNGIKGISSQKILRNWKTLAEYKNKMNALNKMSNYYKVEDVNKYEEYEEKNGI